MGRRKVVQFTQPQVPVPISEAEQMIKARELAEVCGTIDKLRADAAAASSDARKRVRALDRERRVLAECVRTGQRMVNAQLELGGEKKDKRERTNGGVDA